MSLDVRAHARSRESVHDANKRRIEPLRQALRSSDLGRVRYALLDIFAPDAVIRLGHPFGELTGTDELWSQVYAPLFAAMPDMERADFMVMVGPRRGGREAGDWVGLGDNIFGTHRAPWLGIPATRRATFLRYVKYLRVEGGRVVEMERLWEIPQLMLQAGAWPMAPQLGLDWLCPGPAHGTGVITVAHDAHKADASVQLV